MEPIDYQQLLAQYLSNPDAFAEQFGAEPVNDEGEAIRQQMAWAQHLSQPLNRTHSTGQGGMFGAFGDILKGVGGGMQQSQLGDRLRQNNARVGEQKQAQAMGLERLRAIQRGAQNQADLEEAEKRKREIGGQVRTGVDGTLNLINPVTGVAEPVIGPDGQPLKVAMPPPKPPPNSIVTKEKARGLKLTNDLKQQRLSANPADKSQSDDIYKWNSRIQGTGIAKGLGAFKEIDRIADAYGGVEKIPGVGYLEGVTPTEALPADAQRFRQEASALISQYRNKMFGASLTPGEKADFAKIADLGGRATASQVAQALDILRRGFHLDAEESLAGAPPYVKERILPDLGISGPPRQFSGQSGGGLSPDKAARKAQIRKELGLTP